MRKNNPHTQTQIYLFLELFFIWSSSWTSLVNQKKKKFYFQYNFLDHHNYREDVGLSFDRNSCRDNIMMERFYQMLMKIVDYISKLLPQPCKLTNCRSIFFFHKIRFSWLWSMLNSELHKHPFYFLNKLNQFQAKELLWYQLDL